MIIENIVLMPDMGRGMPSRKGQQTASGGRRTMVARPRDAASLILLRGEGRTLEVLAGRRPLDVKFMPGVYVFPGGAIDPPDRIAWSVESGTAALGARFEKQPSTQKLDGAPRPRRRHGYRELRSA